MPREKLPDRRRSWTQKVRIQNHDDGVCHTFFVNFGEHDDGRLAELFITAQKTGTFVRGVLDSLARNTSIALQSGTHPLELARSLRTQFYPPAGKVMAEGSAVVECTSIADYIGQEIEASYGEDGKRIQLPALVEKVAGRLSEEWRSGA